MANVNGAFRADVPKERQRALLETLAARSGVQAAGLVKEDAKSADMRLLFYVRADDDSAEAIMEDLRGNADVEVAEISARRGLA